MVFNLLTNVIIWVYDTLKSVRAKPDYTIIETSMEYYTNEIIPDEDTLDDFWYEEYDEWDGSTMSHYKSLNDIDYRNTKYPKILKNGYSDKILVQG